MYKEHKRLLMLDDVDRRKFVDSLFKNSHGYSRSYMPQIPSDKLDNILIHFAKKYKVYKEVVPISKLKPSQKEYDFNKVRKSVANNKDWQAHPFVVAKDYSLADGHHRYVDGMMTCPDDTEVTCYRINLDINKLLQILNRMKVTSREDIEGNVVEESWGSNLTEEKIISIIEESAEE